MISVILLSSKCSGSSALQSVFSRDLGFNTCFAAGHHENETLFWTKAASILGRQQDRMHRSVVPLSRNVAFEQLNDFLKQNGVAPIELAVTENVLFQKYVDIIRNSGGRHFEKSPHHLFNRSNVQLIKDFSRFDALDFPVHLVGLEPIRKLN